MRASEAGKRKEKRRKTLVQPADIAAVAKNRKNTKTKLRKNKRIR